MLTLYRLSQRAYSEPQRKRTRKRARLLSHLLFSIHQLEADSHCRAAESAIRMLPTYFPFLHTLLFIFPPLFLSPTHVLQASSNHTSPPPPHPHSNLYLGAMLAAPTHCNQAFQHHVRSVSYTLMRRRSCKHNKTSFGLGLCEFVSHGAKLSHQMIVGSATTRVLRVPMPALATTQFVVAEFDVKMTLFFDCFCLFSTPVLVCLAQPGEQFRISEMDL